MSSTSQALKRLGVGSVSVATLLAMPYVGVASALAATPTGPATVQIVSQTTTTGSTKSDGANTSVKISATTTVPDSSNASVAGVRFYSQVGAATPVLIATDTTAPYSVEWTPAAGTYTEIAEAYSAANTVISTDQVTGVVVDAASPSVHISGPAEGASIGLSAGGTIVVSGTRSADLPALTVRADTRDNSDGSIDTSAGPATVVLSGSPSPTASNTWSAIVPVTACPTGAGAAGCDVVITAAATGGSDEVTQASLYNQTLTTFTVTPATASRAKDVNQSYVVTAQDQNSKPVAGLKVIVSESTAATEIDTPAPGTGTATGASGNTGADGTFTFASKDGTAETTTFTVQSAQSGSFVLADDFTRTATLTTYVSAATAPSFKVTPQKALYASQSEYTGSTGTPIVDLCLKDQNGQPIVSASADMSKVVVTRTRTTKTGTVTTPGTAVTAGIAPDADTTNSPGCFQVTFPAAGGEDEGSDTFNAYVENNGTAGFQAGSIDVAATPLTLNYGQLVVTGADTQAQKGNTVTVSFTVATPDGTPFVGRKLDIGGLGGSANLPASQPTGTTRTSAGSGVCTTDASGVCNVNVTDPAAEYQPAYLYDDITDATLKQIETLTSDNSNIDFRNLPVKLTLAQKSDPYALFPSSVNHDDPGTPGAPIVDTYVLKDANGSVLANVPVTVTTDHGFFTPAPTTPGDYTTLTFQPAPSAGAQVGALKSLGTSFTGKTDGSGGITLALGIGRDTGFDDDGNVLDKLTFTANGGNNVVNNPADTDQAGDDFDATWTTDGANWSIAPLNGASVKLLPLSATDKLSGDVPVPAGTNFLVQAKDQFGNVVSLPNPDVALTITGGGTITSAQTTMTCPPGTTPAFPGACWNGFTFVPEIATTTQAPAHNATGSFTGNNAANRFHVDSTTTSTTGQSNTVTATWQAPASTFKAVAPATTPATYTVDQTQTSTKTDSFTVNLYAVDKANLNFSFVNNPGSSAPVNSAVNTSVTVKDQKGNPVQGLSVEFVRSGPNDSAGNAQTGGSTNRTTNNAGQAGTTYSSGTPGKATVTVIVTEGNNSGIELGRSVQNVTFTPGTPTTNSTVSINGPASQFVKYGTRMVVTGKAPANSSVTVYFHRAYVAGLTPKAATANASGVWSVVYSAVDDFSYYAQVGSARAATVLTRIDPSVSGADRTARKGQMVTVSGKSGARSAVNVHVGSAVHAVHADANGVWTYTFKFAGTVAIFANRTEHDVHTAGITIRG